MMPLGNFDLHAPIGRGGMAEVWAGVHRQSRVNVAVKVMTGHQSKDERTSVIFRNEVRAMAGLWHPHIVRVLDLGEVSEEVEALSEGRLVARSPYVAMELVEGGSLRMLCGKLTWSQIRRIVLSLLDALAHAHARGVVHRDIKPGNVLLGGSWHEVKLTDFGLAHALHGPTMSEDDVIGTPSYMAPEQFRGQWRDYGPWTDLYSLGCLVYSLASGSPPFGRVKGNAARAAHLVRPVPPLVAKQPVPVAFHGWVQQLLEKDPARRFVCAADAAWALLGIPDERTENEIHTWEDTGDADELTGGSMSTLTFVRPADLGDAMPAPFPSIDVSPPSIVSGAAHRPPVPDTWRRVLEDGIDAPTKRALGIGVYRLRRIPLVDRENERDALWDALRRVHSGRMGVVVLDGPGGTGTTRLAEWLCERAAEVGAATPLRATHGSNPNPGHGLRPMVIRLFAAQGLGPGPQLMDRVRAKAQSLGFMEPGEALAFYGLVADDGPVQLRLQTERSGVLQRLVARLAVERPVVLWLDDVQWAPEGLAFVRDLVRASQRRPQPVLAVLTARADELADNREVARLVDAIVRESKGARLHVGPLEGRYRQLLVANLLGLRWDVAEQVDTRTQGNPLFAIQLVGDWVDRGLLQGTPQGYALAPNSDVELPYDLFAMWSARLERFLQDRRADDAVALELAATLGQTVDPREWRAVLALGDVRPSPWLVEDLAEARLAVSGPEGPDQGWSFVHGMFRECLDGRAETAGRAVGHHRACARYLRSLDGQDISERVARHHAAAGEVTEAADAYLQALAEREASGLLVQAKALGDELWSLLARTEFPRDDVRWGKVRIHRGFTALALGDWDACQAEADAALAEATEREWSAVKAQAENLLGRVSLRQGRVVDAERWQRQAVEGAETVGDPKVLAQALLDLGEILLRQGRHTDAAAIQTRSIEIMRREGDRRGQGNALLALGEIARQQGDVDEAESHILEAIDLFTTQGSQTGLAGAFNNLGDIARIRGRLVEAQTHYASARRVLASMNMIDALYPQLNLAIVAIEMGRFAEARGLVEPIVADEHAIRLEVSPIAWLALATCEAYDRRWESFDACIEAAERWLSDLRFRDVDVARLARRAADLAEAAGQQGRAVRARRIEALQTAVPPEGVQPNREGR
jgi:serine/threonine protein kinase/tetratricopeptide (TPR) repeat protein